MSGPQVVVVGGGISGAACARELRAGGVSVRVIDRGRKPGGRMASRRLWDRPVDLGASYFTASDDGFAAVVADWEARGLARPWTDTFLALGDGEPEVKSGPMRYGAQRGLRSLVEDLLDGLDLTEAAVASVDELDADAVVLAMPDEQARRLLPDDHPLHGAPGPRVRARDGPGRPLARAHLGPRRRLRERRRRPRLDRRRRPPPRRRRPRPRRPLHPRARRPAPRGPARRRTCDGRGPPPRPRPPRARGHLRPPLVAGPPHRRPRGPLRPPRRTATG